MSDDSYFECQECGTRVPGSPTSYLIARCNICYQAREQRKREKQRIEDEYNERQWARNEEQYGSRYREPVYHEPSPPPPRPKNDEWHPLVAKKATTLPTLPPAPPTPSVIRHYQKSKTPQPHQLTKAEIGLRLNEEQIKEMEKESRLRVKREYSSKLEHLEEVLRKKNEEIEKLKNGSNPSDNSFTVSMLIHLFNFFLLVCLLINVDLFLLDLYAWGGMIVSLGIFSMHAFFEIGKANEKNKL